jgi:hypothetical protein
MRNGQNNNNKRMRNNNNRNSNSGPSNNNNNQNRRGQNPMTRVFESNGPDIKIRGTASHVAEKYVQLARDARSSGDPVAAENYYQHAEHYFRLIAAAQEQFRQNQPQQRTENEMASEEGDDDGETFSNFGAEPGFVTPPPQPFVPRDPQPPREQNQQRDSQPYQPRENPQYQPREQREPRDNNGPRENNHREPRPQHQPQPQFQPQPQPVIPVADSVDRLPSFITGPQPQVNGPVPYDAAAGERFPPRRRRRPHGPRPEGAAPAPVIPGDDFGNT